MQKLIRSWYKMWKQVAFVTGRLVLCRPCHETHSEIRDRCSVTNKGQVKDTANCCGCTTFSYRKTLAHDAITMRYKQKWHKRCCLKEHSSYINPKWHPQRAYLKIETRIPAETGSWKLYQKKLIVAWKEKIAKSYHNLVLAQIELLHKATSDHRKSISKSTLKSISLDGLI